MFYLPCLPVTSLAEITTSRAPQWVNFGRDAHRRKLWLRIQRDPRTEGETLLEFFADGRLIKSKRTGLDLFMDEVPARVAAVGERWVLFFDAHPGAGDSWRTNYLVIRRKDLAFEKLDQFEHGDSSRFGKTRRFDEYQLLKYQEEDRLHFRRLGVWGFRVVEWRWNGGRFVRVGRRFASRVPRRLEESWQTPRVHGNLVGRLDYFRPVHPAAYGMPKDSHFMIQPGHGFGEWTVGLVVGRPRLDEVQLVQGLTTVAGVDYAMGALDPRHPPRLVRSKGGLVLTVTSCAFRDVRVAKFRVSVKPYRISLLGSWLEAGWTPF